MTDKGYLGDEDSDCDVGFCSVRSRDTASSQQTNATFGAQQFFGELPKRQKHKRQVPLFIDEESLREMPGRRMRRSVPQFVSVSASSEEDTVAKPIISHYYASRWLNEYFLSQHRFSCVERPTEKPVHTVVIDKDLCDEKVAITPSQMRKMPLVTSCHRIQVDDAISFSVLPRILIEADAPHRVVHSNAAYARRYGSSQTITSNRFAAPHVENHQELEVAVASLFESFDALVMYPVCEHITEAGRDVDVPMVTHFLIEASNYMPLVEDAMNNSDVICTAEARHHLLRATPAHVIA